MNEKKFHQLRLFKRKKKDMNIKKMQSEKRRDNHFFHKSQNSERTQDHKIAIHDGDLILEYLYLRKLLILARLVP